MSTRSISRQEDSDEDSISQGSKRQRESTASESRKRARRDRHTDSLHVPQRNAHSQTPQEEALPVPRERPQSLISFPPPRNSAPLTTAQQIRRVRSTRVIETEPENFPQTQVFLQSPQPQVHALQGIQAQSSPEPGTPQENTLGQRQQRNEASRGQQNDNLIDLTDESDFDSRSPPEVTITDFRNSTVTDFRNFNYSRLPFFVAHTLLHHMSSSANASRDSSATFEDLSGGFWERRRKKNSLKSIPEVLDLESDDESGVPTTGSAGSSQKEEETASSGDNSELAKAFQNVKCTICLSPVSDLTATVCGHIFCEGCILQAIKAQGKCPICRRPLTERSIHPLFT